MTSISVLTIGPNGGAHRYSSARAAARALSGNGTTSIRNTIVRRIDNGGGYIGNVWVEGTNLTSIRRPRRA